MFICNFNESQKSLVTSLLLEIANSDGHFSPLEKAYIAQVLQIVKVEQESKEDPYNLVASVFDSYSSRLQLLILLSTLAYIDNSVHEKEISFLTQLVELLEIKEADVSRIKFWAEREALQIREAFTIAFEQR